MRGFPKHINCKQDLTNLLEIPEHRERAKAEIKKLKALDDSKATKATTLIDSEKPELGYNVEIIDNPNPKWMQLGFATTKELSSLVTMEVAKDG